MPGVGVAKRLSDWAGQSPLPNGIAAQGGAHGTSVTADPGFPEHYRGQQPVGPRITAPQETRRWWGGDNANNELIYRDRHPYATTGTERTGRDSGIHDVMLDGPVRPSLKMTNRTWTMWQGSTNTRNQDDLSRRFHWLGEQGSKYTPIYGGQPGYYLPYGQRGGPGVSTRDATGPTLIVGDHPHGLHTSPLYRPHEQVAARYRSVPQMMPARVDRVANSNRAGQTYSQTTKPQGA